LRDFIRAQASRQRFEQAGLASDDFEELTSRALDELDIVSRCKRAERSVPLPSRNTRDDAHDMLNLTSRSSAHDVDYDDNGGYGDYFNDDDEGDYYDDGDDCDIDYE